MLCLSHLSLSITAAFFLANMATFDIEKDQQEEEEVTGEVLDQEVEAEHEKGTVNSFTMSQINDFMNWLTTS